MFAFYAGLNFAAFGAANCIGRCIADGRFGERTVPLVRGPSCQRRDSTRTFLRPNFYMQNFSRNLAAAIVGGVLAQPASDAPISFIDTRDVARAAATVLTSPGHEGQVYDLTGPRRSPTVRPPRRFPGCSIDRCATWG